MLLMSMISLPQMSAEVFCNRFKTIMQLSMLFSAAGCLGGLALSAYIDVPCSALMADSAQYIPAGMGAIVLATGLIIRYKK